MQTQYFPKHSVDCKFVKSWLNQFYYATTWLGTFTTTTTTKNIHIVCVCFFCYNWLFCGFLTRGDLTKIHNKAHPPYEVSASFSCSHQLIYHPFSLAKFHSNYHNKSQITSPQPLLVVDLWKHPLFPRFHYTGTADQKHPKNLKNGWAYWWVLVKFPLSFLTLWHWQNRHAYIYKP